MTAAKPEIAKGKKLTAIWIIPLVAAALGIWMVVFTFMTEGPEIEVRFNTAVGLEVGKTRVKFRNVEMGVVQEVTLSDNMKSVNAVIKLEPKAVSMLGPDTRFWLVSARIGGGNISGLDTLLSGAYIEISPGTSQSNLKKYVALEQPPLTPTGAAGLRLVLLSERSASVGGGDPVLYNGYKVGRVESSTFDPESKQIRYVIFIDAPYHTLINSSVRFWDVSGITLNAGAAGFQLSTGSLETILLGGVTFGIAPGLSPGQAVDHNTEFRLFPSYDTILDTPFEHRAYYVASFSQSLKGLLPGAPVEYKGIPVGKVERILVKEVFNLNMRQELGTGTAIPVLLYLEPGRIDLPDTEESLELIRNTVSKGIDNGLRVSVNMSNLLSGKQAINIEFYPDEPATEPGEYMGYKTIPSISGGLGQLENRVFTLLDKVNGLRLETTVSSVNQSLAEFNKTMVALRGLLEDENTRSIPVELQKAVGALSAILNDEDLNAIPGELQGTLAALRDLLEKDSTRAIPDELKNTLTAAKFQLKGESTESYQLVTTLKEVESAARALRELMDLLKVNPEALIRGKSNSGG